MEADRKPFEMDQGGQASDKVIWRNIKGIRDVVKMELDEVVGR
jgi:hypothetical protein